MSKKLIVLSLLFTIISSSCGNMTQGRSLATAQVTVFHEQLNNQDWEAILNTAHSDFLKETSKESAIDLFSAVNRKLGPVKETSMINWNVNTRNTKTIVTLVQNTIYENGKGTETFIYRISNGTASLMGYNINSMDLIIL